MIGVVIPAYNAAGYIQNALASVIVQGGCVSKVVVVNDGSTDGTEKIVQEFLAKMYNPDLIQLVTTRNRGHAAAANLGLKELDTEFVAFLDADDVWLPGKLEKQLKILQANPEIGLVYSNYELIDGHGRRIYQKSEIVIEPQFRGRVFNRLLRDGNVISGSNSAVLIRRNLLQDRSYNEDFRYCEDWLLWLELSKRCEFDFVPEVLVQIRRHGQNLSSSELQMFQSDVRVLSLVCPSELIGEMFFHRLKNRRFSFWLKNHQHILSCGRLLGLGLLGVWRTFFIYVIYRVFRFVSNRLKEVMTK